MDTIKPQNSISDTLETLQEQLYDISSRNPFVDVKLSRLFIYGDSKNNQPERLIKIYKKQSLYLKEFGLETTLFIGLFLKWKLPGKDKFYLSPVLYKPARVKRLQKIDLKHSIETDVENWQVNPILSSVFQKTFDLKLEKFYGDKTELVQILKGHFDDEAHQIEIRDEFTDAQNWCLVEVEGVGTFNYKKSMLGQDYEIIINSPGESINHLLGFSIPPPKKPYAKQLDGLSLDSAQSKVIANADRQSIVIQGPPGTGKSHTIVSLIQYYITEGKTVLFVSEKKSALDVVYQRMGKLKPLMAYFDVEDQPKKSFYKSLKERVESSANPEPLRLKDQLDFRHYKQSSRVYPKAYKTQNHRLEISLEAIENNIIESDYKNPEVHPQSKIPEFNLWQKHLNRLYQLEKTAVKFWNITYLGESPFLGLNPAVLRDQNPLSKIDKRLTEMRSILNEVQHIQSTFGLDLTWDEFTRHSISASILGMVNKSQLDILIEGTKLYKSFDHWAKKYQLLNTRLQKASAGNELWDRKPSVAELNQFEADYTPQRTWFKFRNNRLYQQFFKSYQGTVNSETVPIVLERLKEEYNVGYALQEVKIKLQHNLAILNPDHEIKRILEIRNRLDSLSHTPYQVILERDNANDCIAALAEMHHKVNNLNRIKQFIFKETIPEQIKDLMVYVNDFAAKTNVLQTYLPEIKSLLNIPASILDFIRYNPNSISELNYKVYYNTAVEAKRFEPYLIDLTGQKLLADIIQYNHAKLKLEQSYLEDCTIAQHNKWQNLEVLGQQPNSKLSDQEKTKKAAFKAAKRVIIHEVNKRQRHKPVKDLVNEIQPFLQILKPVWALNPLAIAERLPLIEDLFDVVIFDESSQIPLEDAIPTVYRAKEVIVVGDSKQMPPSRFFSNKADSTTLLDQARHVYPGFMLNWHYRSQHPDLISFSNRFFYDNELKLFPPLNTEYPIIYHYLPEGQFKDNVNEREAEAIAKRFKTLLSEKVFEIAIIAFSKEQENCIRKTITKYGVEVPDTVIIRNLENVQGIEKEVVLISIGYAHDTVGKLRLNFGPVNHAMGERRLNVLFTRAISKMEVFSSITAREIGLSDNRGLMVLKEFINHAQQESEVNSIKPDDVLNRIIQEVLIAEQVKFSFYAQLNGIILNCFVQHDLKRILLVNPGLGEHADAIDLNKVVGLLESKFKAVKIVLNHDWIMYENRTRKEILDFFKV